MTVSVMPPLVLLGSLTEMSGSVPPLLFLPHPSMFKPNVNKYNGCPEALHIKNILLKVYLTIPLHLLDAAGEHFQPVELHEPEGEYSTEEGPSLLGEELLINLGARPDQGEHLPVDVHRGDVRHVDLEEWGRRTMVKEEAGERVSTSFMESGVGDTNW